VSAQAEPARVATFPADAPTPASSSTPEPAPRHGSGRRAYLAWVEERVEAYKETLPRAELLDLAEDVIRELETTRRGQYQLTEVLLCSAMDRRIIGLLKLPSYRKWISSARSTPGS
jgi:hypothetical protein